MISLRNSTRTLVIAAAVSMLQSCHRIETPPITATATYDSDFFGDDINVTLTNHGSATYCFLRDDLEPNMPNVYVIQNGARLESSQHDNREFVRFRGANVANGIHVIPPGKRDFFVNIANFPIEKRLFSFSVIINVAKCSNLFGGREINWQTVKATIDSRRK